MTDRPLQVVHDGQPRAGHSGSFRCSFAVQFAGIPLAQVVQIGDGAPPAVLELGQLLVRIRLGGSLVWRAFVYPVIVFFGLGMLCGADHTAQPRSNSASTTSSSPTGEPR